jgi:hypothetical protein
MGDTRKKVLNITGDNNGNIFINPPKNNDNLIINNTLKVSHTYNEEGLEDIIQDSNRTGNIFIKDQTDGYFKRFYVDNNEFFIEPMTDGIYNEPVRFIESSNLQTEIETLSSDNTSNGALVFSNIYLANDGIINFLTTDEPPHDTTTITGFKVDSGELSFKNSGDGSWTSLTASVGGATNLNQLSDVSLSSRVNNQVLLYDSGSSVFRNSNIIISTDTNPTLGGNLSVGDFNIIFNNSSKGLVDSTSNSIVRINNANTTDQSYLVFQHSIAETPEITVEGNNSNIDMVISSKGSGDIDINSGNLDINSSNINLTSLTNLSFSSGFIQKSINTVSSLSTNNSSPTSLSSSYNIILFNISGNNGTYYATLGNGINGQCIDIIYDTLGNNNTINISFNSKVGTGTGLYDTLTFTTAGQSSSLVYLGDLGSRNRWQVLNTGALIS